MSGFGKFAVERGEALVEEERDAAVRRVRHSLARPGGADICGCGAPIPAARRLALPNTRECVDCALDREARGRMRWK